MYGSFVWEFEKFRSQQPASARYVMVEYGDGGVRPCCVNVKIEIRESTNLKKANSKPLGYRTLTLARRRVLAFLVVPQIA